MGFRIMYCKNTYKSAVENIYNIFKKSIQNLWKLKLIVFYPVELERNNSFFCRAVFY